MVPRPLRRVVAAPGALNLIMDAGEDAFDYLARHATGDWGELCAFDRRQNKRALRTGERVLSAYPVGECRIWIITEADRFVTTILLPEEYWRCGAPSAEVETSGSRLAVQGTVLVFACAIPASRSWNGGS
jgi:hypothetical protein